MTTLDGLILSLVAIQVAATAWMLRQSLPAQLRRSLEQCADVSLGAQRTAEATAKAWEEERTHLASIVEHMEDVAETIQKRRARIVAENRRAEVRDGGGSGDTKQELRRRAGLI